MEDARSTKKFDQSNAIERSSELDWARSSSINTMGSIRFDKMDEFEDGFD